MVNVVGSKDNYNRWKPKGYERYLTMAELCARVDRSRDRIKQLEREGVLARPIRVKVGMLRVRLYSPQEVAKIVRHFKNAKPGRRRKT